VIEPAVVELIEPEAAAENDDADDQGEDKPGNDDNEN